MLTGQILYHQPRNPGSASKGALAVYQGDDGRYITVKWLRNELSSQQGDGGYYLEDFRVATQDEIDAHSAGLAKAVEEFTAAVAANPRFTVGDYVYKVDNRCHNNMPFKVVEIYNGVVFAYRDRGGEDEHTTHKVEELELRPHFLANHPPRY